MEKLNITKWGIVYKYSNGSPFGEIIPPIKKGRYLYISIGNNLIPIHHLVADKYIESTRGKLVKHKNGNTFNNKVENLEVLSKDNSLPPNKPKRYSKYTWNKLIEGVDKDILKQDIQNKWS